jgi:hypothetical protein
MVPSSLNWTRKKIAKEKNKPEDRRQKSKPHGGAGEGSQVIAAFWI